MIGKSNYTFIGVGLEKYFLTVVVFVGWQTWKARRVAAAATAVVVARAHYLSLTHFTLTYRTSVIDFQPAEIGHNAIECEESRSCLCSSIALSRPYSAHCAS